MFNYPKKSKTLLHMAFNFPSAKFGITILTLFFLNSAKTQPSVNAPASTINQQLINEYQQKIKEGSLLLTGSEYGYPDSKLTEHPFLKSDKPFIGSIHYFGIEYQNVPMQYDILRDELVLASALKLRLVREKINHFTLDGRSFIHLNAQNITEGLTAEGFYEELLPGDMGLLAQRRKKVKEILSTDGITYQVSKADVFFIRKATTLVPIQNRRQFLQLLGDSRKKIATKLRKDRIKYRLNPEFYLLLAMRYYQQPNTL